MKITLSKTPLPRVWKSHPDAKGVLLEKDIGIGGRLRAKLLVFEKRKQLRQFWKGPLGKGDLGRECLGAVNGLFLEVLNFKGEKQTSSSEVDPRYFCIIGLVKGHLSMEIISHEAVHAAFNFAKRKTRSPWSQHAAQFDEEAICYPAGRIAAAINRVLHAAKLY